MIRKQMLIDRWPLFALWIVANLVGWAAGLVAGVLLTQLATAIPGVNEDRVFLLTVLLALAVATGVTQWQVMISLIPRPQRWVGATFAGYLLGLLVGAGMNEIWLALRLSFNGLWDDAILLMLVGMAIGIPQWWILRQHYRNAWAWVPAVAAGFLVILWIIANPVHSPGEGIVLGTIEGTLASAVPGAALIWLVQHPVRQP